MELQVAAGLACGNTGDVVCILKFTGSVPLVFPLNGFISEAHSGDSSAGS